MPEINQLVAFGISDLMTNLCTYLTVAGIFFLVFWIFFKDKFTARRIQQRQRATPSILQKEVKNSIIALLIFMVIDVLLYTARSYGYTQLYMEIGEMGWGYWAFSIVLITILHDTYFYWAHRWMHHPLVYKHVHKVHHESVDPSPFAALSLHPLEALVDALPYVLFSLFLPLHLWTLLGWQFVQIIINVIGHLGYEVYPKALHNNRFFIWKTSSTHHNMHHSKFNGNYAFYFTWWDRWMGTEFKDYRQTFDQIHQRVEEDKEQKTYPSGLRKPV